MSFGQLSQTPEDDGQHVLLENGRRTPRGMGYQFDDDTQAAVDVALELGRPLLISGEPGVGKTELGYAIARRLRIPRVYLHSVKSTSDASELFYTYDALQRLRDAQLGSTVPGSAAPQPGPAVTSDAGDYVDFQAMGRAILDAHNRAAIGNLLRGKKHKVEWNLETEPCRSVVVIDEIDKAPKDFPNDLLHEIEAMTFRVKEFPDSPQTPPLTDIPVSRRPVVVITSNEERQLPDAFLRRCVFLEIPFPDDRKLRAILRAGLKLRLQRMGKEAEAPDLGDDRTKKLIRLVREFREKEPDKKPGIAEMLDAAALLFAAEKEELSIVRPAMVKLKRDAALFDQAVSGVTAA